MAKYRSPKSESHPKAPAPVIFWLLSALLLAVQFVVSPNGFDQFRLPKDILVAAVVPFMWGFAVYQGQPVFASPIRPWEYLLLSGVGFVFLHSLLISSAVPRSLYGTWFIFLFVSLVWLGCRLVNDQQEKVLWLLVGIVSAISSILTVLQFFGMFPLLLLPTGGVLEGRVNAAGLIGEVNSGGFLFGLVCFPLIHGLLTARTAAWRSALGFLLAVNLLGLVVTMTVAAIIAFGVGFLLWFSYHHYWVLKSNSPLGRRPLIRLWCALLVFAVAVVIAGVRFGLVDRLEVVGEAMVEGRWNAATSGRTPVFILTWQMITSQAWTGTGLNTFGQEFFYEKTETPLGQELRLVDQPGAFQYAHNEYLQIWEELGVMGLLLFLALLIWAVGSCFRGALDLADPEEAYRKAVLAIAFVFVAVESLAFFPLHLSATSLMLVLLCIGFLRERSTAISGFSPSKVQRVVGVLLLLFACLSGYWQVQVWRANGDVRLARQLIERATLPLDESEYPKMRAGQLQRLMADQALLMLNHAQEHFPSKGEVFNLKGSALMLMGRFQEATTQYSEAARRIPSPEVLTNLGVAYLENRQFKEARQSFEQALRYNPRYRVAEAALKMVPDASS